MAQEKKKGESISKQEYIGCYNSEKDPTSGKEIPNKDLINKALEIALDTRKFEIELYWKRTGYFVLFTSAVFVGYYRTLGISETHNREEKWLLLLLLSFLGFLLSLLWYMANRGSKFWQENWEAHIEMLSTHLGIPIFGIIRHCTFSKSNLMKEYPFSVSKVNQMVSLIVTASWLLLFAFNLVCLISKFDWTFFTRGCPCIILIIALLAVFIIGLPLSLESMVRGCESFAANVQDDKKEGNDFFYNYQRCISSKTERKCNHVRRWKILLKCLIK